MIFLSGVSFDDLAQALPPPPTHHHPISPLNRPRDATLRPPPDAKQLKALVPSTLPDLLFRLLVPLLMPHAEEMAAQATLAVLGADDPASPTTPGHPHAISSGVMRGAAAGPSSGAPAATSAGVAALVEACVGDWEAVLPWVRELAGLVPVHTNWPRGQGPGSTALAPAASFTPAGTTASVTSSAAAAATATATAAAAARGAGAASGGAARAVVPEATAADVGRALVTAATAFGVCAFKPSALPVSLSLQSRLLAVQRALAAHLL